MKLKTSDLIEPLVALGAIFLLCLTVFSIMKPFLAASLWAAILVLSTWKPYLYLVEKLNGRRALAAILMLLTLCLFILLPVIIAASDFANVGVNFINQVRSSFDAGWPALPDWLTGLPLVGEKVNEFWVGLGAHDAKTMAMIRGFIGPVTEWVIFLAGQVGGGMVMMLMSLFIAFFIYQDGEHIREWVRGLMERVAGERSTELLAVSVNSTKGVVYGFLGTAVAQALLSWIAYVIAGVPNAMSLGFASFIMALLPGGPVLLGLPAAAWLYHQGDVGWSIFLAAWMLIVVSSADNVIKPILIGKGSNLPFILILFGVLGGALAFGMLGVFIGPVLLTIFYEIARNWVLQPSSLPPEAVVGNSTDVSNIKN
ncbi:AI-2E family transporter (plasmid) [Chitinibacter bivalviorum]|uniref:AI-2E family transporter n=1 Tax=Chitinibacter bivalviorum TaxID=2739434 RepID=A0A7H9BNY8_9NEIS|nr:AI-2E family transporter [Chitinibacter bivalviorum]QLG88233.1 AI-2E family transporter [Chitinibacter bivalviorum]QLG90086.1 AI-2E family transporter [Chitinibacter bivalviorum]